MMNFNLNRRKFFEAPATAAMATQVGASILASTKLSRTSGIATGLLKSIQMGDTRPSRRRKRLDAVHDAGRYRESFRQVRRQLASLRAR